MLVSLHSLISANLTGSLDLTLNKVLGNALVAGDIGLFVIILLSIITAGISLAMLIEIDMKANHREGQETVVDDASNRNSR